jgi:hypothetical protein
VECAGEVTFTERRGFFGEKKVTVDVNISGLSPGPHGFHIHVRDCLSVAVWLLLWGQDTSISLMVFRVLQVVFSVGSTMNHVLPIVIGVMAGKGGRGERGKEKGGRAKGRTGKDASGHRGGRQVK